MSSQEYMTEKHEYMNEKQDYDYNMGDIVERQDDVDAKIEDIVHEYDLHEDDNSPIEEVRVTISSMCSTTKHPTHPHPLPPLIHSPPLLFLDPTHSLMSAFPILHRLFSNCHNRQR